MQHAAKDFAARKPDTTREACPAPDPRQLAERHRAIGIAAVAAAVRYQGAPDPGVHTAPMPR